MSLQRIIELAEVTGRIREPGLRAQLRRLARFPDRSLEELLLRKLAVEAGDDAFDPPPYRTPSAAEIAASARAIPLGDVVRRSGSGILAPVADFSLPIATGHVCILGATRAGKSMAVRQLLLGALKP